MLPSSDQAIRDRLISDFDHNFLVEASAGSGKTTVLVERLVQMLAQGHAKVHELAALTFTRKAAGEMRSRFFIRLEAARTAAEDSRTRKRLTDALASVHQAYIGTIHGFCARILREYANEAGMPAGFAELSEEDAKDLRDALWTAWLRTLTSNNDPIIERLGAIGIKLEDLRDSFYQFSEYSDIPEWPAETIEVPVLQGLREKLLEYHQHMAQLGPHLPVDVNDRLMQKYRRLPRLGAAVRWHELPHVMLHLEEYEPLNTVTGKRRWPGGVKQCDLEWERWNRFCESVTLPLLHQWRTHRYRILIDFMKKADVFFQKERLQRGLLSFQDLLYRSVELVRQQPAVRRQLGMQWKRLLIDEFQDTDPLQAELLFLLTARRAVENWVQADPRPGSLLFVGDPKQSIYRFRRADMQVYQQVKNRLESTGGEVLQLTANFRSQPALVEWINNSFSALFSEQASAAQVEYMAMQPGRSAAGERDQCLRYIAFPEETIGTNKDEAARVEAEHIARFIQEAVDGKLVFERTDSERARGVPETAVADDFMILTTQRDRLQHYGEMLTNWGIPNQVSGGAQLNEFPGLRLLYLLLKSASNPHDAVALVGLLRSELCGLSDAQLFAYQQAGGRFLWSSPPDGSLPHAPVICTFFGIIQQLARDLEQLPVMAALQRTMQKVGLSLWARVWGETGLGCLAKAVNGMEDVALRTGSVQAVLVRLVKWLNRDPRRDGLFLPSQAGVGVRIMNLHKAKGLEARVVILADCLGGQSRNHQVDLHVERGDSHARGFMNIRMKLGRFADKTIAYPVNWDLCVERETAISEAEKRRLLYVAATRARDLLVICYRTSHDGNANKYNPWQVLIPHLSGASAIDPDQERQPKVAPLSHAQQAKSSESLGSIETAWKACLTPKEQIQQSTYTKTDQNTGKWSQVWQVY